MGRGVCLAVSFLRQIQGWVSAGSAAGRRTVKKSVKGCGTGRGGAGILSISRVVMRL